MNTISIIIFVGTCIFILLEEYTKYLPISSITFVAGVHFYFVRETNIGKKHYNFVGMQLCIFYRMVDRWVLNTKCT